tara:strand:- start:97 stop:1284 length:1188 start_codon:yes stop_codon:yes gene_type:complete
MADRSGYIGRAPSDSSVVVARQVFKPTGIQTNFTFASGYNVGYLDAYINGAKQIKGEDYTATDGSVVVFSSNQPASGDVVELVAYKAFNLSTPNATGNFSVGGDLTVTGDSTFSGTLTGDGSGLTGVASTDYIITGTAATFNNAVNFNAPVALNNGGTMSGVYTGGNFSGVVTATSFSGSGANLTGIDATSIKDSGGNVKVQGNTSGIVITGITSGLNVTGVATVTTLSATTVSIGGTLTYEDVTNIDSIGIITARSGIRVGGGQSIGSDGVLTYYGDGSSLTGIEAGISTEDNTQSGGLVIIDLSKDDHKFTASGICTVTTTSTGTEGGSGTLRITNSGITTIGFSTYFLWPSGSAPSIPTGDGTISLISYTIQRNGAAGIGTQLLSGASLNFS